MKIGFTGTQIGMTPWQLAKVALFIAQHEIIEARMGDCIGADKEFYDIVTLANKNPRFTKIKRIGNIPNNDSKRAFCQYDEQMVAKPYLERNHDIVDDSEAIIAIPKENEEQQRSGTWATIRYAKKKKKHLLIFYPDGTQEEFAPPSEGSRA